MSLKKAKTRLSGYEQVFPAKLDDLNSISEDSYISNGSSLENDLGGHIEGFSNKDRPTTEDGYCWFWGLEFKVGEGSVRVLYPWAQDWDKNDGSQKDRSISIYKKGNVNEKDINELLERIHKRYLDYAVEYKAEQARRLKEEALKGPEAQREK